MSAGRSPWKDLVPYCAALAVQALVFHRHVLFFPGYILPWDFRSVHLPFAVQIADSFRRGDWPLWDPFSYCGMPLAANIQAAVFYPPMMLAALLGSWLGTDQLPRILAFATVVQIIFAGICTFALLRRLGTESAAAWIGGSVYELGCFFAAQAEHLGAVQGAVWLPLVWLCAVQFGGSRNRRWMAALAVSLAMTVLAGLPQVSVAAFASALAFVLLLAAFRFANWRLSAHAVLGCVWGLAVAAVQFLPTAELTQNSVAKYRFEWMGTGGGIPPSALISLVIPNYWGVFDPATFRGPIDLTFLYLYSSSLGLLLAVAAAVWKPGRWAALFGILLGAFTLAMLGDKTALGRFVLTSLPNQIRNGIHPEFLFCGFSLALAVLAGLGAERFLNARWRVAAGIVIVCDLILVGSGRPMNVASLRPDPGITHDAVDGDPEIVRILRAVTQRGTPPYRFDARPNVPFLWSNSGAILGIPGANGCDPMAPERTIEARRAFAKGPRWGTCYQVEKLPSPILDSMGVRAVVSLTALDAPGLRLAGEARGYKIYENTSGMERFFFVNRVQPAGSLAESAAIIQSAGFQPSELAVIEAPGDAAESFPAPALPHAIRVVSYAPASIRLETVTSTPSFLVAAESYYPGWEARIDGAAARIYATNAAFRGVRVPAGRHTIEFRFFPRLLYGSAVVSGIALIAAVAALLV